MGNKTQRDLSEKYSDQHTYLICNSQDDLIQTYHERLTYSNFFPWAIEIHLKADRILINIGVFTSAHETNVINTLRFISKLLDRYQCKLTDDKGRDWTALVNEKGAPVLFGDDDIQTRDVDPSQHP